MRPEDVETFRNYDRALAKLQQFTSEPADTEREVAGIIQAFEFTFEQLWKSIQKLAASEGVRVASPKAALEFALAKGLVRDADEPAWVEMLRDRNLTSHTYNQELAHQIAERIRSTYLALLQGLAS